MDGILTVLGGFAGVALGGFLGFHAGERVVRGRGWLYWTANAVGAAVGIGVAAYGLVNDSSFLWIGGLAFFGTWVTGLKYGYARNPGVRMLREAVNTRERA